MMKTLICWLVLACVVLSSCLFTSCYGFVRADKMAYYGNMFGKPSQVFIDSVWNAGIFSPQVDTVYIYETK